MPLLLPLIESQYFYLEIILHILQDYDTDPTVQPAAQPWKWKSVSQGAYIHGNTSSSVMLHTANEGWSFLGILLSSYRNRQTYLVWTWRARSVMQQIAALAYYSQTEQDRVNQNSLFHSIHSSCPREQSDCVFGLFFHTFTLSHRGTYKVPCQSQRK